MEAARALARDPTSAEAQVLLHTAAQGILEGTMKVYRIFFIERTDVLISLGICCYYLNVHTQLGSKDLLTVLLHVFLRAGAAGVG